MANTNETFDNAADATKDKMDAARAAGERFVDDARAKAEYAGEKASEFADNAGTKLKDAATVGKDKAADGVHALADATRNTAAKLDAKGKAADYANRAAEGLDHFSERLKDKSLDDMAADAKSFVKDHPAISVGAAALIGFALARVIKSGLSGGNDA